MRRLFLAICRINLKKGKSCQINSWQVWAQRKITIISWHDTISVPVLPISDAVHCNRPRSALHPSSQCTASVPAVHCIRSRKYLQPFPQVLATVLVSTCRKRRLHLGISSPMFFLLTKTSAIFIGQNQKKGCLVYYYETASLALQDGLEPTTP